MTHCIRELLDHRVIELGRGQTDAGDLFIRRGKGLYVVVFYEGDYFRQPISKRATNQKNAISADPLFAPLQKIGVDSAAIRRIFKDFSRGQIERWIKITDAAMHEKPRGFPGFKASPAAFLIDGIQHDRLPPDWIYAHEKRQHQKRWEQERSAMEQGERSLRDRYEQERSAALTAFLHAPDGRRHFQAAYEQFLVFYQAVEPHRSEQAAADAASGKIEREQFDFPEFGVWLLEHRS